MHIIIEGVSEQTCMLALRSCHLTGISQSWPGRHPNSEPRTKVVDEEECALSEGFLQFPSYFSGAGFNGRVNGFTRVDSARL